MMVSQAQSRGRRSRVEASNLSVLKRVEPPARTDAVHSPAMMAFPDQEEVRRIAALADGAARNALITTSYFELSAALGERLPGEANWCTFATWASRQAGVTIRHQDLVGLLRERLLASEVLGGLLGRVHARIVDAEIDHVEAVIASVSELGPLQRSGDAVARGNQKVYEEIGLEFARFLTGFPDLVSTPDAAMEQFSGGLRGGEPPAGQGLLQAAFANYRSAARAQTAGERAEWVLLANSRIGFHEQIRLQADILAAMDGAVIQPRDLAALLLNRFGERRRGLAGLIRRFPLFETPLRKLARGIAEEVAYLVRVVATEHLARLTLPDEVVRLGDDLLRPFPADLESLRNSELVALLTEIAPAADRRAGSGAEDWANLGQRMRFIAALFRAYQRDETLFAPP